MALLLPQLVAANRIVIGIALVIEVSGNISNWWAVCDKTAITTVCFYTLDSRRLVMLWYDHWYYTFLFMAYAPSIVSLPLHQYGTLTLVLLRPSSDSLQTRMAVQ